MSTDVAHWIVVGWLVLAFFAAATCHGSTRSVVRVSLLVAVALTALCMSLALLPRLLYRGIDRGPAMEWETLLSMWLAIMSATYVIAGLVGLTTKSAIPVPQPGATGPWRRVVSNIVAGLSFVGAAAFVVIVIGGAVTEARIGGTAFPVQRPPIAWRLACTSTTNATSIGRRHTPRTLWDGACTVAHVGVSAHELRRLGRVA